MSDRSEFIAGLRAMADFYETHEDFQLPYDITSYIYVYEKQELVDIARTGGCKKHYSENYFRLVKNFSPTVKIEYSTGRNVVCEKVVVGTELVEEVDPEFRKAQREAEKEAPKVLVEKEVVDWKCHPLLAESND